MKNLYTLQECFEKAGNKFPFNIIFYDYENPRIPSKYKILNKKDNHGYVKWLHSNEKYFNGIGKDFELDKGFIFDKDIKEFLDDK